MRDCESWVYFGRREAFACVSDPNTSGLKILGVCACIDIVQRNAGERTMGPRSSTCGCRLGRAGLPSRPSGRPVHAERWRQTSVLDGRLSPSRLSHRASLGAGGTEALSKTVGAVPESPRSSRSLSRPAIVSMLDVNLRDDNALPSEADRLLKATGKLPAAELPGGGIGAMEAEARGAQPPTLPGGSDSILQAVLQFRRRR